MYHIKESGASAAARILGMTAAFPASVPWMNFTLGSGEICSSHFHEYMKSAFVSGFASTTRTSQLGHFLKSQVLLWFCLIVCLAEVTPVAMAVWLGPLTVIASWMVWEARDHAHL